MKTNCDYWTFNQILPNWMHPTHNKDWHSLQYRWEIVSRPLEQNQMGSDICWSSLASHQGSSKAPALVMCCIVSYDAYWGPEPMPGVGTEDPWMFSHLRPEARQAVLSGLVSAWARACAGSSGNGNLCRPGSGQIPSSLTWSGTEIDAGASAGPHK